MVEKLALNGKAGLDEWRLGIRALQSPDIFENMRGQVVLVAVCEHNESFRPVVTALLENSLLDSARLPFRVAFTQISTLAQVTGKRAVVNGKRKPGVIPQAVNRQSPSDFSKAMDFGEEIGRRGVVPAGAKQLIGTYSSTIGGSSELICQAILLGACRGTRQTRQWGLEELEKHSQFKTEVWWRVLREMASQNIEKHI